MTKAGGTVLSALGALVFTASLGAQTAADYKIVVNAANPVTTLTRDNVARIFLKKTTTWPNGQTADPVDQPTSSPTRRAFSKAVLDRDPAEVANYWNRLIFSGRGLPPLTRSSDAEVLSYVRDHPNAIGYVAGGTKHGEGVKDVTVQ